MLTIVLILGIGFLIGLAVLVALLALDEYLEGKGLW